MASIVGEKHRNAAGSWPVTDKIFGYIDKLSMDYKTVKQASLLRPGDPGYDQYQAALKDQKTSSWIPVLVVVGITLVGLLVYNAVKKGSI